jgi:SnoaL-like domain
VGNTAIDDLMAKQAITEVLYRYCRGLDRMDRDLVLTVWHEGAPARYDMMFDGTGQGFIDWVWPIHETFFRHSHQITNILIDVDGDRAVSEAYVTVALRSLPGGDRIVDMISRGRYLDRWSKRDGRWAIDDRVYVTDLQSQEEMALTEMTDTSTTASRRDGQDPSFLASPTSFSGAGAGHQ